MSSDKPIHILVTVTEDGESVAYEKWVSEEELALYLEGSAKQPVREKAQQFFSVAECVGIRA